MNRLIAKLALILLHLKLALPSRVIDARSIPLHLVAFYPPPRYEANQHIPYLSSPLLLPQSDSPFQTISIIQV